MAENWNAVAVDVLAGLTEAGVGAFIVRAGTPTGPVYNPTPGVPVAHPVTVVYDEWRLSEIDGTLIRVGDLKILVASSGLTITPTPNDVFRDATGAEKSIINVEPLQPGGVAVMYVIQARG
jgi:hypothetical protein